MTDIEPDTTPAGDETADTETVDEGAEQDQAAEVDADETEQA